MALMKAFVFALLTLISARSPAFESDQYTLPKTALEDVGPFVSRWAYSNLKSAVDESKPGEAPEQVIDRLLKKLAHCDLGFTQFNASHVAGFCISRYVEKKLLLNPGFSKPTQFLPRPSIYTGASAPGLFGWFFSDDFNDKDFFWRGFAANANFYGVTIGLDKIGHFLKLGRDYFREYLSQVSDGATSDEADRAAISKIGVWHEMHLFGKTASGIYSNADLATNLAGLKFYQRMFFGITLGREDLKPVVVLENGRFRLNSEIKSDDLFRPFISKHMSEALNPNWFTDGRAALVRLEISKRCRDWSEAAPAMKPSDYNALASELKTWNGLDYGYREQPGGAFTVGNVCNQ
ncbi:MAG: hypothetical protein ABL958_18630 [Bdellovibrionia bacterium]